VFPCPCCECLTLGEAGAYEICPVCFWEDDPVQEKLPDSIFGANRVSLKVARVNFASIGAAEKSLLAHVRPPTESELQVRAK
jgi:Cysteine-rich CPCC